MDPGGLIHHLCDDSQRTAADPVRLLARVREKGQTCSEFATEYGTTRSTVYRIIDPFVRVGFLTQDRGIEFTGAGQVFFGAYENATDLLDRDEITFLSASPFRISVLYALEASPARKADLAAIEGMPSRATIQRAVHAFHERGWISGRDDGVYELTEEGQVVLDTYECFLTATEQAIEKAPFLRRLGEQSTKIPLDALVGAQLIEESKHNAHAILDVTLVFARGTGASAPAIDATVPVYSQILFDTFEQLVASGVELRLLFDSETYHHIQESASRGPLDIITRGENLDWRVYPEPLQFSVGTDGERVLLVAYGDFSERPVALISRNESFVEWAGNLIDEYWNLGSVPSASSSGGSSGTEAD